MVGKARGGMFRVRGADLDAGVRLDTEAGPIDFGLALSETAVGLVVDAPGLGRLRVAFDVDAGGAARLTALSRKSFSAEPFVAPIFVMDQARVDELRALLSTTQGERDVHAASAEALAERLRVAEEQLAATLARLSTVEGELPGATEALGEMTAQRDEQLAAAHALEASLEAMTAERDALQAKLADASESAMDALGAMTAERDALEATRADAAIAAAEALAAMTAERDALDTKLTDAGEGLVVMTAERDALEAKLAGAADALGAMTAERDGLEAKLEDAAVGATDALGTMTAKLAAMTADREELDTKVVGAGEAIAEMTAARDALDTKLADTTAALEAMTAARDEQLAAVQSLDAKLADAAGRLSTLEGELPGATQALAEMTSARDAQLEAARAVETQLEEKTKALEKTETELADARRTAEGLRPRLEHAEQLAKDLSEQVTAERRRGTELTARRFDAEEALAEMTEQRDASLARAQTLEADHDAAVQALRQTEVERDGHAHHASSLETSAAQLADELAQVTSQLALSQQEAERAIDEVRARLAEVEQALTGERERSAGLEVELAKQKDELALRQATLEEEQALRDEMVRDLAFIQSQVSDLSTTKGALVSRIDQMSKREVKRQKSSAEISDLLRDAEVVAADKQTTARRLQAHAGRLEEQLVELNRVNEGLQTRLVDAETAHAQLLEVTGERDRLKVDIAFFQKQLGAMQRTAQARPAGPGPVLPARAVSIAGQPVPSVPPPATGIQPFTPSGVEGRVSPSPDVNGPNDSTLRRASSVPSVPPVVAPVASPARAEAPIAAPPPVTVSPVSAVPAASPARPAPPVRSVAVAPIASPARPQKRRSSRLQPPPLSSPMSGPSSSTPSRNSSPLHSSPSGRGSLRQPTASCEDAPMNSASENPVFAPWTGPWGGVPAFDRIQVTHFKPAIEAGMASQLAELDAITNDAAAPTFANTIVAFEKSGAALTRALSLFGVWAGGLSTPDFQALETELSPKLSAFRDSIIQNAKLFARIKAVYDAPRGSLTAEQQRLLWRHYTAFTRQGAALDDAKKASLSALNQQLATLTTRFSQNQLGDEEEEVLVIETREGLAGLPASQIDAAAQEATRRGKPGVWMISNTRSSMEPFLISSADRSLRERGWRMWTSRGDNGNARDNNAIAAEILLLRAKKAKLLGFPTFAHWRLDDAMAKDPQTALDLMLSVWAPARDQFRRDVVEIEKLAGFKVEPWDYRAYAERLRKAKYDLDLNELKPYLQLDRLREAMFWVAGQLYGLRFEQRQDLPVFHPDVTVYEVWRAEKPVGLWYFDPYARPAKQSGAWMSAYRDQQRIDGEVLTLVSNNSNFIKGQPISWDDARTMFHEFGHALHGLNSNVTYPSLSGTNTTRDFVEFPSQLNEHWLSTPEVLKFLVNELGQPIPKSLIDRLEQARTFNEGFATAEAQASAIVDMKLHLAGETPIDPKQFEQQILAEIGMPPQLVMRHRIPAFAHIFSGDGYAAGYYSYIWAEVLERDAYEAFLEAGGPYDRAVANRLYEAVMSVGDTVDPAEAFRKFRGRDPRPDALLRAKGFAH